MTNPTILMPTRGFYILCHSQETGIGTNIYTTNTSTRTHYHLAENHFEKNQRNTSSSNKNGVV